LLTLTALRLIVRKPHSLAHAEEFNCDALMNKQSYRYDAPMLLLLSIGKCTDLPMLMLACYGMRGVLCCRGQ